MARYSYKVRTPFSVEIDFAVETEVVVELGDDDPNSLHIDVIEAIEEVAYGQKHRDEVGEKARLHFETIADNVAKNILHYVGDSPDHDYLGPAEDEPWQESNPGV